MISPDSPLVAAAWSQLWQVTAVVLIVGVVVRVLCKRRPHLAHVLWMLVILKCLTPPLWSSPTSLFSWLQTRLATSLPNSDMEHAGEHGADVVLVSFVANDASRGMDSAPVPSWSMLHVIAACWFSGIVICCGVIVVRRLQSDRLLRRSRAEAAPALITYTAALARRLRVRGRVRVVVTSSRHGPAAMGVLSPAILLPAALVGKLPGELEPVLAHELIHIRRGDNLFGILQLLAQILWWFHPLVWWANRNANRAIERCCDEETVASLGCEPAVYARCLLDVLELKQSLQAVYLSPGMRPAEMTAQRLEDIMKRANGFHRRTPRWCWGLLALTVGLVLPGKEMVYSPSRVEAEEPERKGEILPNPPTAMMPNAAPEPGAKVIPIKDGHAAEVASAISNFLMKRANGKKPWDVVVSIERDSNTLRISRATPDELAEITRLVESLNAVEKQFVIAVTICEGKPVPTLREAIKKGKLAVLSRPRIMTLDNQTALVNVGRRVEIADGAGKKQSVPPAPTPPPAENTTFSPEGSILQVTASSANDKRISLKLISEISTFVDQQKDQATHNVQRTEHIGNHPLGERILIPAGMTNTGNELWIELTVMEVNSHEQELEVLKSFSRDDD